MGRKKKMTMMGALLIVALIPTIINCICCDNIYEQCFGV